MFLLFQVLQKSLDEFEKNSESISETLGKVRDENEDLRFQVFCKNLENNKYFCLEKKSFLISLFLLAGGTKHRTRRY